MKATKVLGVCGASASALAAIAGFADMPMLLGISGAVMFVGNLYAIFSDK